MAPPHEPVAETVRYDSGTTKYTGFLLDGEMHGAWSWYRVDGSIMRTGEFDRGRQVGRWRTFDRKGKVVKESTFDAPGTTDPPADGRGATTHRREGS